LPPTPAIGRSDVDNYAAATMDAITRAGVWTDDTRCARLTASKVWIREQDSDEYTHIMISTYTSVW
jgi:Holliday junction resolvase RusA-like endonuclease